MPEVQPPCSVRSEVQALVDRETTHLRREIAHLREMTERTAAKDKEALELQRTEYLRRLDELNNAHARAEAAVRATVPRETFDVFASNYNRWREEVVAETGNIKASAATRDRIFYVCVSLGGLIVSAITIWMAFRSK